MQRRIHYPTSWLPYALVAPQVVITLIFFIWPAMQAVRQSFLIEDAFGLGTEFVWFENFEILWDDPHYLQSFGRTFLFAGLVTFLSMSVALLLAGFADHIVKGAIAYRTMMIWPYAVAPALAGVLWMFMLDPSLGIISYMLAFFGIDWDYKVSGTQAMIMVVLAASWKQLAYNFLFYYAAIQSIPKSLIEASAIDGAGPIRRFRDHVLPMVSPTTFFLLVINLVYAFFDTFAIVDATTAGGPARSTEFLVYKVFKDGYLGLDLGGSAAQSVILMILVIAMTAIQFGYLEKKVQY